LTQNQSGATPWEFESPPRHLSYVNNKKSIAYILGVALGDGNLSNPNGKAIRLRVTCDKKYPLIIKGIVKNLKIIFLKNKVSIINKGNAVDISVYSNELENLLGWKAKGGSKIKQKVGIPVWIKQNKIYSKECLRGLLQTDGSIYNDRGYKMVNFTSAGYTLIKDTEYILKKIGFLIKARKVIDRGKTKYVIRISKNVEKLIKIINLWKK
jgi:LAGLIDADG-like domain